MSKKSKKPKSTEARNQNNLKRQKSLRLLKEGMAFHRIQKLGEAEQKYREAINSDPLNFQALYLLGIIATDCSRYRDAIDLLRLALKVRPLYAEAWNDLGVVHMQTGNLNEATLCYQKALEINEHFAEAMNNAGVCLQSKGDCTAALELFEKARTINPKYLDAHTNLIFSTDLVHGVTVEQQMQARKDWDKFHAQPLMTEWKPHRNDLTTNRKLRIGYVSGDLRLHSASFVFGSMLVNFDRENFEVYVYSNTNFKDDTRSLMFKQNATVWRNIVGLDDKLVVDQIRQDKIDILVDLSGYSAGHKLLVFARKPAPIQVTAWGYATSTGMKAMDYFFADEVIVPHEETKHYVEEVVHLKNVVSHFCPEDKPDVEDLPAIKNGYITFGSFNRLTKVSEEAFEAWCKVLHAVPNSKMLLKIGELGDEATQKWALDSFNKFGIGKDRLEFLGKTAWFSHMGTYNKIDICLDPFPHGGGVTTLEGLVMGVPVVTLRYPTVVGRLSASILTTLDMPDWIAESVDEYVEIAVEKAKDIEGAEKVRKGLRDKLLSSIIGDCVAYTCEVEQEYRKMWVKYVESKHA